MESETFYEGAEKLLEIYFSFKHQDNDLRQIPRCRIDALLDTAKCSVLSTMRSNDIDAYILSESSMFVTRNKVILKTCGNTRLLETLRPLIQLACKQGFDAPSDVCYRRKNFIRPQLQDTSYQRFENEVAILNEMFHYEEAQRFGEDDNDCWYLYSLQITAIPEPKQTLEMTMRDLDPRKMALFSVAQSGDARTATLNSCIHTILPDMAIDDYLFQPHGYSMNGLRGRHYITIHITPEPKCSYVSFETDYPMEDYTALVEKVVSIFQPGRFTVTTMTNHVDCIRPNLWPRFTRREHIEKKVKGYWVAFHRFF